MNRGPGHGQWARLIWACHLFSQSPTVDGTAVLWSGARIEDLGGVMADLLADYRQVYVTGHRSVSGFGTDSTVMPALDGATIFMSYLCHIMSYLCHIMLYLWQLFSTACLWCW